MAELIGVDNKPKLWDERLYDKPKPAHFGKRYYCIFRIGKKFYSIESIGGFQVHMNREIEVPNADKERTLFNKVIIGPPDVKDYAEFYLKNCKTRKNSVLARELLLTATHGFFNMSEDDINKWIELQKEWLVKNFGDNCIWAVCHKDENLSLYMVTCIE